MPASASVSRLAIPHAESLDPPRHAAYVRLTHWIHTVSFFALVVSGIAILIAHPRLYWGETGALGAPSLLDLPLPFTFGPSGWGRSLHFLSAWVAVFNGGVYLCSGLLLQHFRRHLWLSKRDLAWGRLRRVVADHVRLKRPGEQDALSYNVLQRLAYLSVVFGLFPLMIVTGLAMSPAITSVVPALVNGFGGQQSARTVHFFGATLLVFFLLVHISMVCLAGFGNRMRAMITGHGAPGVSRHEPHTVPPIAD
jgi:thiosulfate reductase cytochrome b subunit